jgi:ribosome-associated protein
MNDAKDSKGQSKTRTRTTASRTPTSRVGARRSESRARKSGRDRGVQASRELALLIADTALEKKAAAVEILDVVGKVDYADFLVLMTGRSTRHVDTLAHEIEAACERKKRPALSVEGLSSAAWVLLDFGDVVVHVFQEDARGFYDIEGLWLDAKRLPVPGGGSTS